MWFASVEQLLERALALREQDQYKKAIRCLQKALKRLARREESLELEARVLQELGELYLFVGDLGRAYECIEKSQSLGRELSHFPLWRSAKLRGDYSLACGQAKLAVTNLEDSLKLVSGEDPALSLAYRSLSSAHTLLGNYQQAVELLEKALLVDSASQPESIALTLWQMAYLLAFLGQRELAEKYWRQACEVPCRRYQKTLEGYREFVAGTLAFFRQDLSESLDHYQRAHNLWSPLGWKRPLVRVALEMGLVHVHLENLGQLKKLLRQISRHMAAFQAEDLYVSWGYLQTACERMEGKYDEALETLSAHVAVAQSEELSEYLWQLEHLEGKIWEDLNELEKARDAYLRAIDTLEQMVHQLPQAFRKSYSHCWMRLLVLEDASLLADKLESEVDAEEVDRKEV